MAWAVGTMPCCSPSAPIRRMGLRRICSLMRGPGGRRGGARCGRTGGCVVSCRGKGKPHPFPSGRGRFQANPQSIMRNACSAVCQQAERKIYIARGSTGMGHEARDQAQDSVCANSSTRPAPPDLRPRHRQRPVHPRRHLLAQRLQIRVHLDRVRARLRHEHHALGHESPASGRRRADRPAGRPGTRASSARASLRRVAGTGGRP